MALARVVSFEGVSRDRADELAREVNEGDPPEGFPGGEMVMLHDPASDNSLVIFILDNEDDYRKAHEILDAMPTDDTPGRRTSVTKYDVVARMTS
jgi:hypothetical protein